MRPSLRNKIVIISVTIFCLIIGANTWVNGIYFTTEYSKARQSEVFVIIQTLKSQLDRLLGMHIPIRQLEGFEDLCREVVAKHPFVSFAMVLSPDGEILFHSNPTYHHQIVTAPEVVEAVRSQQKKVLTRTINGRNTYDFFLPVLNIRHDHVATIRAGFPLDVVKSKTRQMALYSVSITLISLLLGIVLLILVLNLWVTGPINHFIASIRDIRKNWSDPDKRVRITTQDDIGQLAAAFNQMTDNLRRTTVSKNYVDSIIGNMLNSILVVDPNHSIRSVNQATLDLLGYQEKELLGEPVFNVLAPPEVFFPKKNDSEPIQTAVEAVYRSKAGQLIPVLFSTGAMHDEQMQLSGYVCVAQDMTRLKQAEKEKIKAQNMAHENKKLALIGQVAGKMAHDFNNILSAVMGIAELEKLDSPDPKTTQSLDLIIHQILRGKNLTKNLVIFAKSHELKQEFFNINDKVELVLSLMATELKMITVSTTLDEDLPDLLADPGMIEHCLVNILQNAVHALSKTKIPEIRIKTFNLGDRIAINVADNGCGIPEEHLDHIFEPSFTLKGSRDITRSYQPDIKGTGYGMANVKKYIDQHKGEVRVDSDTCSGTTVTLVLPVLKKELSKEEMTEINTRNIISGKRILILEDEPAISYVQQKILSHPPCNHQVDLARTARSAIGLLENNTYDLISLDYILPGKLNGIDIYTHIRKTDKTVPILFASGNMEFLEAIEALKKKDPRLDHLSKPCRNMDYINSINRLMQLVTDPPAAS